MSEGLNKVQLIGGVVSSELRFTQSQQPVLSLRMATTEVFFDGNSKERKERVEYHSLAVWGKRGEGLSKVLSKGSRIYVEGRLQTRSYEKNGEKRYATEVNVQNVLLLGGGPKGERTNREEQSSSNYEATADGGAPEYSEDVPF